jgi:hypothetical protein
MKTTFKAKVVISSDRFDGYYDFTGKEKITISTITNEINTGNPTIEWINDDLGTSGEPTIIIKI